MWEKGVFLIRRKMSPKINSVKVACGEKVFDIKEESLAPEAWWWWFWLFFFDNPKNPDKPRQLMILWSAKNTAEIDCNGLMIKPRLPLKKESLDGAVAAWYYDGEKMNHNFLLERCNIEISKNMLYAGGQTPTTFSVYEDVNEIKIGERFKFMATASGKDDFVAPSYHANNFLKDKGYAITKINRLDLTGIVDGVSVKGTAYFQRVLVNGPAIPWYWGAFHFEKGAVLTYTNQFILGKAVKKNISFYDGKSLHIFKNIKVRRVLGDLPQFKVSGSNSGEKINFTVSAYSQSSWTFTKNSGKKMLSHLVYNEYPSVLSDFEYVQKKTKQKLTLNELGNAVGNSEHTKGYLY
jgi:hypothetical protein